MNPTWMTWAVVASMVAGCSSEAPKAETAAQLRDALEAAEEGDTVEVGSGRFEGEFTVPPGVNLRGSGRESTVLFSVAGLTTLTVLSGNGTQVSDLRVESGLEGDDDQKAILVIPPEGGEGGRASLERLDVHVDYGKGIGVQLTDSVTLSDLNVVGSVTEGNAERQPSEVSDADGTPYGVLVIGAADAQLSDLSVTGFASIAVQLVDSASTWNGGRVSGNLGASVLVAAGSATLQDVQVSSMLKGFRLVPPYGLAITDGASVDTTGLSVMGAYDGDDGSICTVGADCCSGSCVEVEVEDGVELQCAPGPDCNMRESVGILQDGSASTHRGLLVTANAGGGVWVQRSSAFQLLDGAGENDVSENGLFGVGMFETTGVRVQATRIEATRTIPAVLGDLGSVNIGDGMSIRRCAVGVSCGAELTDIRIEQLALDGNGRAALLIEAQGDPASGVFCGDVDVGADGEYGAVVQNNDDSPQGWDAIARTGADDVLDTVEGISPDFLPSAGDL